MALTKKVKKLGYFALSSVLAVSSIIPLSLTSCTKNKTKDATSSKVGEENATTYANVTFANGGLIPFKYIGKTIVKTRVGLPFGTVTPPKVVCDGYNLVGWTKTAGSTQEIKKTELITEDGLIVYPILQEIESDLVIDGPKEIYSGFREEDVNVYTLSGAEEASDASQIVWSVQNRLGREAEQVLEFIYPTEAPFNKVTVKVHPEFYSSEPDTYKLIAIYNGTATQFSFTILPPFYRTGTIDVAGKTLNCGTAFWAYNVSSKTWEAINIDTACSVDANFDVFMLDALDQQVVTIGRNDDTKINRWSFMAPGREINEIPDNFMANTTYFNAILLNGVDTYGNPKIISTIGNSFLDGCTYYNVPINNAFVFENTGMTIGNDFMAGCVSFNNGGESLQLPTATKYGDGFMSGCTSLNQPVIIPSTVWDIGQLFMFGCENVKKVIIPSNCEKLVHIGRYFLLGCNELEKVQIETETINYFEEISSKDADKGSFVKLIQSAEAPDPSSLKTLTVSGSETAVAQFFEAFEDVYEYDGTNKSGYYRLTEEANYEIVPMENSSRIGNWNFVDSTNDYDPDDIDPEATYKITGSYLSDFEDMTELFPTFTITDTSNTNALIPSGGSIQNCLQNFEWTLDGTSDLVFGMDYTLATAIANNGQPDHWGYQLTYPGHKTKFTKCQTFAIEFTLNPEYIQFLKDRGENFRFAILAQQPRIYNLNFTTTEKLSKSDNVSEIEIETAKYRCTVPTDWTLSWQPGHERPYFYIKKVSDTNPDDYSYLQIPVVSNVTASYNGESVSQYFDPAAIEGQPLTAFRIQEKGLNQIPWVATESLKVDIRFYNTLELPAGYHLEFYFSIEERQW